MSIRCGNSAISAAIAAIDDTAWQRIDYTDDGEAHVAETTYTTGTGRRSRTL
jgi:hypothetical protein